MSYRRVARIGAAVTLLLTTGAVLSPAQAAEPPAHVAAVAAVAPPLAMAKQQADGTMELAFPALSRADLIDMIDPAAGPYGALDATRAHIAQHYGYHLPDMHRSSRLMTSSESAGGSSASTRPIQLYTSGPSPAGDLDGDGADDVLVYALGEKSSVRALSGADGSTLWQRPKEQWIDRAALPLADVSGDGAPDLFSINVSVSDQVQEGQPCWWNDDQEPCQFRQFWRYTWTYGVISGADGSDVWSAQTEGTWEWREWYEESKKHRLSSQWEKGRLREIRNGSPFLDLTGDHDDDGVQDVLLNRYGYKDETVYYGQTRFGVQDEGYRDISWGSTRSSVLAGPTGAALLERSVEDVPGFGVLSPAPQLVGDATPDLLWDAAEWGDRTSACRGIDVPVASMTLRCRQEEPGSMAHVVSVVDGSSLEEAWSVESERSWGSSHAYVADDISGDGVADIIALSGEDTTNALSGPSGVQLWQLTGVDVIAAGVDLTGTGRPDVLSADFADEWRRGEPLRIEVRRHLGTTGEEYQRTNITLAAAIPGAYPSFGIDVVDAGGTSAVDVFAQATAAEYDHEGVLHQKQYSWHLEDGTGAVLRAGSSPHYRRLLPFGDLDGDGLTDAIEHSLDEWSYLTMRRIADDGVLWSVPENTRIGRGGNQDGQPGDEVMLSDYVPLAGDAYAWDITSVAGATGAHRWTARID